MTVIWVEFGGKPPPASVLARFAGQESISREEFQQAWAEGDLPAQVVSQVGMLVNQWQTAVLIDPRSTHAVGNDEHRHDAEYAHLKPAEAGRVEMHIDRGHLPPGGWRRP